MKIKYSSIIATVILLTFITSTALAYPGQEYACNSSNCHTYSPQSINITTDINSIIVNPNEPFMVNISWSDVNPSGVIEINWPTNFANNTLFNPNPRIPAHVNTQSGTTNSTLTAPQTPGTYTVRVYSSRKSPLVTDFKDITVIVQASYNVRLSVDSTGKTTSPGVNASYLLTINNTGNALDNFTIEVSNPDGAAVGLSNTLIQNLAAGANAIVLLNVTNTTAGTFRVNVTANSTGDPSKIASVNTMTRVNVPSVYGVSLSVDSTGKTTSPGINATYKLTINNSGSTMDNYTLVVSNPDGAAVGLSNTWIQNLAAGANATVILNVSNASAGTFRVNVTASSTGYPNRTASVNTSTTVRVLQLGGAPNIISYSPKTTFVKNNVGDQRTFNIKSNSTANVTWYIYDAYGLDMIRNEVFSQIGVTESSYANTSAASGIWIVKAIASNQNGTDLNTWIWFVSQKHSKDNVTRVRIEPRTLNLASKGKFTASISLAEGYDVADLNISTLECEGAHALKGEVKKNGNVLQVKVNRQDLVNVSTGNAVRLTVTGMFMDGTKFEGSDIIRVINNGKGNDDEEDDEDESEADDDNEDEKEEHSDKVKSDINGNGKKKDSDKVKTNSKGKKVKNDRNEDENEDDEDED